MNKFTRRETRTQAISLVWWQCRILEHKRLKIGCNRHHIDKVCLNNLIKLHFFRLFSINYLKFTNLLLVFYILLISFYSFQMVKWIWGDICISNEIHLLPSSTKTTSTIALYGMSTIWVHIQFCPQSGGLLSPLQKTSWSISSIWESGGEDGNVNDISSMRLITWSPPVAAETKLKILQNILIWAIIMICNPLYFITIWKKKRQKGTNPKRWYSLLKGAWTTQLICNFNMWGLLGLGEKKIDEDFSGRKFSERSTCRRGFVSSKMLVFT